MLASDAVGQGLMNSIFLSSGVGITGTTLVIRSGSAPAHPSDAATGTVLATCAQVGGWIGTVPTSHVMVSNMLPSGGLCFQDASADATGTAGYWRLMNGSTTLLQGSVGVGSGELQLNSLSFTTGQQISITQFNSSMSGIF